MKNIVFLDHFKKGWLARLYYKIATSTKEIILSLITRVVQSHTYPLFCIPKPIVYSYTLAITSFYSILLG